MLNSAEHEILNANKYINIMIFCCCFFQAQKSLECYFVLLINVKMPTVVGILTFTSKKNFTACSAELSVKKNCITSGPDFDGNEENNIHMRNKCFILF